MTSLENLRAQAARISTVFLAIFGLCLTGTAAQADGAGFKVCNQTGSYINVAYIYRSGLGLFSDSWAWQGYYELEAGECGFLFPTHDAINAHMAIYSAASSTDPVTARILGPGDVSSNNRSATTSSDRFCRRDDSSHPPGTWVPLGVYRLCDDSQKTPYSVYWTGLGQTHRDVNNYPHTLYIEGLGTAVTPPKPVVIDDATFDDALAFLARVLREDTELSMTDRCPIRLTMGHGATTTIDLSKVDPERTTLYSRYLTIFHAAETGAITETEGGLTSFFFGGGTDLENVSVPLNNIFLDGLSAPDFEEIREGLLASFRLVGAYCAQNGG